MKPRTLGTKIFFLIATALLVGEIFHSILTYRIHKSFLHERMTAATVRVSVRAGDALVVREGSGTGEANAGGGSQTYEGNGIYKSTDSFPHQMTNLIALDN